MFGGWPSFHDAEITEMHLERGEINPGKNIFEFPKLTLKILLWNHTSRVKPKVDLDPEKHTLVVLQFSEVDGFSMSGFNHQNAIMGLEISVNPNGGFRIRFDPAFGMGCDFECGGIEVLNALPWDTSIRPLLWVNKGQLKNIQAPLP